MNPAKKCRIVTASRAALLLLSMLVPLISHAAALGDELILSQLGDPVEVEIALMQWDDVDLDQVQITAGTPEVYESFGLDYLPAIESLNFNLIGPNLDGEVKVLVSSREPMQEPYLELLLVMRWPGGSLLREYVLLFDPPRDVPPVPPVNPAVSQAPVSSAAPPAQAPAAPVTTGIAETNQNQDDPAAADFPTQQPEAAIDEPPPQRVAEEIVTVREIEEPVAPSEIDGAVVVIETDADSSDTNTPPASSEGGTYTVDSGDNLWDIASKFGPPGADIYQILLGIYELNRGAFINGNISLLKYGVALRLPTTEDVAGIDPVTAKSLFDQRWEEGSERIEMAERGEPLPPFSSIFAPEIVRPEFNPTAPLPDNQNESLQQASVVGGQVPATGALVPGNVSGLNPSPSAAAGGGSSQGQPGVPVVSLAPAVTSTGASVPQAGTPAANTNAATSANPYMDSINSKVQLMNQMLAAKQQQVELLEAQMSEMNTRMLEISRVTERLNDSLDEALAQRERQQEIDLRNTYLLGGLVALLSVAVIAIVMMALKLVAQIRVQHELLQNALLARAATPTTTNIGLTTQEPLKPQPVDTKASTAQKYMAPAHALTVSIIEDEDEVTASHLPDTVDTRPGMEVSKEELDATLGDMELDKPDAPHHSGSR